MKMGGGKEITETTPSQVALGCLRRWNATEWIITEELYGRPVHLIKSGDVLLLEVDGVWKRTRIEYVRGWFSGGHFLSVDGYTLREYGRAALPVIE
jgi:hypothetical protein